ncbi:MAG TPA: adenosine deaminase [Acidimicrobiia bacterium]|nr:adenosine deaminase [Acidimicrobiia bacterium]
MDGATLHRLPKVVLHDHLDGGLRPQTVLDLAEASGYQGLPTTDLVSLRRWFYQGESRSLPAYLEAFRQTVAVMQDCEALERVACEAVLDLAADGAVYAEIRFAPMLHRERGLTLPQVVDAVLAGLAMGRRRTGIAAYLIIDALRQDSGSEAVAAAAAGYAGRGVVGFDLAGPEEGFPASAHRAACRMARAGGLHLTLHAGEAAGVASIADALGCGAERLGHGVRLVEDMTVRDGRVVGMGAVAERVRSAGIALEVCPSSNVHTRVFPTIEEHPVGLLHRSGFAVTINTDNRLMSGTSMSGEFALAVAHQGFTVADLRAVTLRAVDAAFCDPLTREETRERVVAGYPVS